MLRSGKTEVDEQEGVAINLDTAGDDETPQCLPMMPSITDADKPKQPEKKEDPPVAEAKEIAHCWGCGLAVFVPAPKFRCPHCGAVTETGCKHKKERKPARMNQIAAVLVSTFVAWMVFSVIGFGSAYFLPALFPNGWTLLAILNYGLTAILSFNTAFNFIAASLLMPYSKTPDKLRYLGKDQGIQKDALYDCTWCFQLGQPMPARAHYDRVWHCCVQRFDHFCIFIGSSVGRHNHRQFMRFILWLIASTSYCLLLLCVLATECSHSRIPDCDAKRLWSGVEDHTNNLQAAGLLHLPMPLTRITSMSSILMNMTGLMMVMVYVGVASLATTILVSMLIQTQLACITRGYTYYEDFRGTATKNGRTPRENLDEFFASSSVFTWLLPSLTPLPEEHSIRGGDHGGKAA